MANNSRTEVGPGDYDFHSPRVHGKEEIKATILNVTCKLDIEKIWVNPA